MTLFHHLGIVAASGGVAAAPGMVLLTPTSIAHSGTSASIGANGQVTFTAVTSLSLNGVFSADFDNYVVSVRVVGSANGYGVFTRLRASGTDDTGSNYTVQTLAVDNTSVTASRASSTTSFAEMVFWETMPAGATTYVYGPALAQPTAYRHVHVSSYSGGFFRERAATHSQSTSYDGMSFIASLGNITGALQVYGVRS